MTDVKLLTRWIGWCDPCEVERPLLLTETGARGLRAWLHGIGHEDRALTLTCAVCGEWQDVPHDEEDAPEPVVAAVVSPVTLQPMGARQLVLSAVPVYPAEPETVPLPRTTLDVGGDAQVLELLSEGLDLITVSTR